MRKNMNLISGIACILAAFVLYTNPVIFIFNIMCGILNLAIHIYFRTPSVNIDSVTKKEDEFELK